MASAQYCIELPEDFDTPTNALRLRAEALGCGCTVGNPGGIIVWPSVVVMGNYTPPVIIPDDSGQATIAQVTAAVTAATGAENQAATTKTNIYRNVTNNMTTIAAWIAANPNGATLNAAQTLVLAKMLNGIGKIL